MARCEQGYLCDVCGEEVHDITESDLYLGYVLGLVRVEELQARPERHVRCNPVQAQFIVDPAFPPITVEGVFDKHLLDADYVREQEDRVTRAWQRLQTVRDQGLSIAEYPLPRST